MKESGDTSDAGVASALAVGATSAEIHDVFPDYDLAIYAWLREAGATHAEAMEVLCKDVWEHAYIDARKVGAPHADLMEAAALGIDLWKYRSYIGGASHTEILHAYTQGCDLDRYGVTRWDGATHLNAIEQSRQPQGAA